MNAHPSRRVVLLGAASLPVLAWIPRGLTSCLPVDDERVLVVLQLTGGNDGLNTVVPFEDDLYHRGRPVLAISTQQIVRLDEGVGLHPALAPLRPLWDAGALAIVRGVGYPEPNRSHFRSLEIWHTASTASTPPTSGWLGRLAAPLHVEGELPVVRVGERDLPLALAGAPVQVPAIAAREDLELRTAGGVTTGQLQRMCSLDAERSGEAAFVARATGAALDASTRLRSAIGDTEERRGGGSLLQALRLAADLIHARVGTRVIYVTLGGFDTHARQAQAHATLLRELAGAITGFQERLSAHGDAGRAATLVFSEFGRRIHENASTGTDHGAGNILLVSGSPVRGGLIGPPPDLTGETDADVPVSIDFRRVYVSALEWLGLPTSPAIDGLFERLPLFA